MRSRHEIPLLLNNSVDKTNVTEILINIPQPTRKIPIFSSKFLCITKYNYFYWSHMKWKHISIWKTKVVTVKTKKTEKCYSWRRKKSKIVTHKKQKSPQMSQKWIFIEKMSTSRPSTFSMMFEWKTVVPEISKTTINRRKFHIDNNFFVSHCYCLGVWLTIEFTKHTHGL